GFVKKLSSRSGYCPCRPHKRSQHEVRNRSASAQRRHFLIFPYFSFSFLRFFVTSPPMRPVSLDVRERHPLSITLSSSPSSSATSYFSFSSGSRFLRSIGFSFFFPILCLLSAFSGVLPGKPEDIQNGTA